MLRLNFVRFTRHTRNMCSISMYPKLVVIDFQWLLVGLVLLIKTAILNVLDCFFAAVGPHCQQDFPMFLKIQMIS